MMATWSESEDEFSKEENEKEVAHMCVMAIDELDEVNSNISYDDLHDAFEDLNPSPCLSKKHFWLARIISKDFFSTRKD